MRKIRGGVIITSILIGVGALVLSAWVFLSPSKKYEAEQEFVFYYPPMMQPRTNKVDLGRIGATDALFHMRSALASLARDKSQAKIVAGFMRQHAAYSSNERVVKKAFQGMTTEMTCGSLPSLKIRFKTESLELSRMVADYFANVLLNHFNEESKGLTEKMCAWFESQKVGKDEDEIKKIENQERDALRNADRKFLKVRSVTRE